MRFMYKISMFILLLFAINPFNADARQLAKRVDAGEAGFYRIEPITFSMQQSGKETIRQTTSEARIWYSYHPSRAGINYPAEPVNKPLFVMMNGGPGSSTSTNLFSMNTAPYTLDKAVTGPKPASYAVNPHSWTKMGNLLYIDAPNTGFSYNVLGNGELELRARDFATSYNPFLDAAQVLRVVLRFLREHPQISANQVVMVGESYGATRASTMLNMLLFYTSYRDGSRVYADPALVSEIEQHLFAIHPAGRDGLGPEVIAEQFGRQIFIEPQLTGPYQDDVTGEMFEKRGSIIDVIATADKKRPVYKRCKDNLCNKTMWANYYIHYFAGKDEYNYTKPSSWSDDLESHAMTGLLDVNVLSRILDYDVRKIDLLRPEARKGKGAYRDLCACSAIDPLFDEEYFKYFLGVSPSSLSRVNLKLLLEESSRKWIGSKPKMYTGSTLEEVFGILDMVDEYLVPTNTLLYTGYKYNTFTAAGYDINQDSSPIYGELFLQNLPLVKTFITDAAYDLVIYPPALPVSFKRYSAIVDSITTVRGSKSMPGRITINYKPGSLRPISTPVSKTIYYPYYGNSGHSVSTAEPQKLISDIQQWLLMSSVQNGQ